MRRISYRTLKPLVMPSSKMTGAYCLAQFSGDGLFYRAKILRTIIQTSFKEAEVCCLFVCFICLFCMFVCHTFVTCWSHLSRVCHISVTCFVTCLSACHVCHNVCLSVCLS